MKVINLRHLTTEEQNKLFAPEDTRLVLKPGAVFIGRRFNTDYHLGNPFTHKEGTSASVVLATREEAVNAFKEWILGLNPDYFNIDSLRRSYVIRSIPKLIGHDLVCYCAPKLCHGHVIAKWLENPILSFQDQYRFLSNFFPSPIYYKGVTWRNAENLYQWSKQRDTDRESSYHDFAVMNPSESKTAGRNVVLRDNWEIKKETFMLKILSMKFDQNPNLRKLLINTGDSWLVEGNTWHDNYWGSCSCSRCGNYGLNSLGVNLMKIRELYKNEEQ